MSPRVSTTEMLKNFEQRRLVRLARFDHLPRHEASFDEVRPGFLVTELPGIIACPLDQNALSVYGFLPLLRHHDVTGEAKGCFNQTTEPSSRYIQARIGERVARIQTA